MGVRNYLQLVVLYWYIVVAGLLVGLVGAGALTSTTPRSYASQVTLMLAPLQASGDLSLAYQGILLAKEKATSYMPLLTSEPLAGDVVKRLRLDMNPVELVAVTTPSLEPDSVLIKVRVTDGSPERAQRIAEALGQSFITLVDDLERPVDPASLPPLVVKVVEPAIFSDVPVSPDPVLNLGLGAILGLLGGLAGARALNAVRMSSGRVNAAEHHPDISR